MNHLITRLIATAAVLAMITATAAADYAFRVPLVEMQVFVNPNASTRIVYDITFTNQPRGRPIDVVDIGVPHSGYNLGNVKASIDGVRLSNVRVSEYVKPGFEVHLASKTIAPGRTGKLHVEFTMPDMVYQDTTREDYASLQITPTWFGEKYVRGGCQLKVAVHLPPGVQPDEALYHGHLDQFSQKAVFDDRTVVVWQWPVTSFTGPHKVGVSFPKRDMQRVVIVTKLDLLVRWFGESTGARVIAGVVFFVLFGILYFRFTGGTGISVFLVLSALAVWVFVVSPGWHLLSLPIVVVLIGVNEWLLGRRKTPYMPPIAQIEGGGIKRGLTAPEAAVLLELPLAKVLSLVVFGMLKKGILRQLAAEPLTVDVDEAFGSKDDLGPATAKDRKAFYRKAGQQKGIVVHKYEHGFIYLLRNNPGKPAKQLNFSVPMKTLIERVVARMKGFDLSDTKDYYRSIITRAVEQAKAIGDIPQREKAIDRHFEWILMDDHYPTVFTHGRPYRPVWSRGHIPSGPGAPMPSMPGQAGQTSFGDVAGSFAGWTENTMGSMASAISPGSLKLPQSTGGFLNLSGADHLTGEFFQALSEASTSGGGGGGGCACAGCACACACAGGGR